MRANLCVSVWILWICCAVSVFGQQAAPAAVNAVVPPVIKYSSTLTDVNSKPLNGTVGVTFSLYKDSEGGAALWVETQNVTPDKSGHYTVLLGSTSSQGLPASLFNAGDARWLGVEVQGEAEQPRVLLMSVPYALKAADAETLGGKPLSAFQLISPSLGAGASGQNQAPAANTITCVSGTACKKNFVPLFYTSGGAATVNDSIIQETGSKITVTGNLSATGVVTGSSYQIGSHLFAFGSASSGNAFLGFAGNSNTNTESTANTGSGFEALLENTTGSNNTANGYWALFYNSTGADNTAVGNGALTLNTTGVQNTASGSGALYNNAGSYNTASGYRALYFNTSGYENTAAGDHALYSNTAGYFNTATGASALWSNTTGEYNTAAGYLALGSSTTATDNTASGFEALEWTTTGSDNDADGYDALRNNTTGNQNTANGSGALFFSNGSDNTASGYLALTSNSTGSDNTAAGAYALYQNSTGNVNTAVGYAALYSNTTGSYLTCIGYDCSAGRDNLSNATAIGAHAVVSQSNTLVLGGTGEYAVKVGIGTATPSNILTVARGAGHPVSDSWETYSSRRWKTNIKTLPDALSKVERLRGVSYDLKDSGKHEIGVIAEEVGAVVPEVVTYEDNGKDARGVDYSRMTALLIEATKEQQVLIRTQQEQIARLSAQVRAIRASLKTSGHTGSEVRRVKAQVPTVGQ